MLRVSRLGSDEPTRRPTAESAGTVPAAREGM